MYIEMGIRSEVKPQACSTSLVSSSTKNRFVSQINFYLGTLQDIEMATILRHFERTGLCTSVVFVTKIMGSTVQHSTLD